MRRGMVGSTRSRFHRPLAPPATTLPRCFACIIAPLACFLTTGTSAAQDPISKPVAPRVIPPADSVAPEVPPILRARPDVAVRRGCVSMGTAGRLVVAQETEISRGLRSTLRGSVTFEAPGDVLRDAEPGVRNGFMRLELNSGRGYGGEIGFLGDPLSRTIHGRLEAQLPGALSFNVFAQTRSVHNDWGDERVNFGTVGLRRELSPGLLVQPGLYVVDVRARNDVRWIGTNLRIGYRGAEFFMNHEAMGSRFSTRKTWSVATMRVTLGGQLKRHPTQADHGLLELGFGYGRVGVSLYPGDGQRAILLMAGAFQIGFSQRPALHQAVFGFRSLSLSVAQQEAGPTEIGFGFVFRGVLRRVARTPGGWQWHQPLPRSAIGEPHLRWPGLASILD